MVFIQPYILADYPKVTAFNTLRLSFRMMKGNKLKVFFMQLGFWGWQLLGFVFLIIHHAVIYISGLSEFDPSSLPPFREMDMYMLSGWILLVIYYIAYIVPYYNTVNAGYYAEIKDNAIATGIIEEHELGIH
jgi:uncharacterized membrane protein